MSELQVCCFEQCPIKGRYFTKATDKLQILGQSWHIDCFKCHFCYKTLEKSNFRANKDKPYCRLSACAKMADAETIDIILMQASESAKHVRSCIRCKKDILNAPCIKIRSKSVTVGDQFYHVEHFTCFGCRKEIPPSGKAFMVDQDGYCNAECCKKYLAVGVLDNVGAEFKGTD